MEGHKGPIISLITVDPKDLFLKTREEGTEDYDTKNYKILSASLDNSIRLWDSKDMSTITIMENDERSELSSMDYLIEAGLVATGHEDGHIKLWNLEIGTCV
jgi:WD40 repeat protein